MIDAEEFERFYRDTAPVLEKFMARLTNSRSIAEELVQETYYRFLRANLRLPSEEERRRYLYRIAVNLEKNRRQRTREHVTLPDDLPFEGNDAARLDVAAALRRISPRDRALLWLAYVEGYSHREIAEVMRVGVISVRVLLSRARRRFMKRMESR